MADEKRPHLHVEFFADTKQNKRKSAEAGRPVFDDVEKVRIRFAGDRYNVFVGFAHDQSDAKDEYGHRLTYAQRFPEHYKHFKQGMEYHGDGTPLSEVTFLTAAQRKTLETANVYTLEALAGMDGSNLQKLGMGARDWKNQAQALLDKAAGNADLTRYAAQNEAMAREMAALRQQVAELTGGAVQPPEPPQAPSDTKSPFLDWGDETIRLWIEEQGGEVDRRWGHKTLVEKADALNARLAAQKEAA